MAGFNMLLPFHLYPEWLLSGLLISHEVSLVLAGKIDRLRQGNVRKMW
jgi:hypothetical protein